MTEAVPRFKDFTLEGEAPVMRIAPDEFRCYPEIPLDTMMDVAQFSQTEVKGLERFRQLLDLIGGDDDDLLTWLADRVG